MAGSAIGIRYRREAAIDVMAEWLAQQPAGQKTEKDTDASAKAYSAKRGYEGSSERSRSSGGDSYGTSSRSSGQNEDRGRQQTGVCYAFKKGVWTRK